MSVLRSCSIVGRATLSAVKSLAITSTPSAIATSTIRVPGASGSGLPAVWVEASTRVSLEAVEKAWIVGADPVHSGRGEPSHRRRVVHRPSDQLDPGLARDGGQPRCDQRVVDPHRLHPEPGQRAGGDPGKTP